MKKDLLLVFLLVAYGCSTTPTSLPYEPSQPYNFQVIDQRDEQQKSRQTGSFTITACDYAVNRLADNQTTPDRVAYLQYALARANLPNIGGKDIVIKRFTLYDNSQAFFRKSALNAGVTTGAMLATGVAGPGVATGSLINQPTSSYGCAPPASEGGFSTDENPSFQPAAISELLISIDGRDYFARAVEGKSDDGSSIVKRTIIRVVDNLVAQMK